MKRQPGRIAGQRGMTRERRQDFERLLGQRVRGRRRGHVGEPHQRARMNGVSGLGTSIARGAGPIAAGCLVSAVMSSGVVPVVLSGWIVYTVLLIFGLFAYWTTLQVHDEDDHELELVNELEATNEFETASAELKV